MKKILSVLLIISTLFLYLGFQACFAENTTEENNNEISQSIEDLNKQIKSLKKELKNNKNTKENKSVWSKVFSFISSTISTYFIYCIAYGSIKTILNLDEDVDPSIDIPVNFIPAYSFPFRFLRRAVTWIYPDSTISINLGQKKCAKTLPDWIKKFWFTSKIEVYCDSAGPLKDPVSKWVFFTVEDAPCALLRGVNSIYNFIKYNIFDYGNFFKG